MGNNSNAVVDDCLAPRNLILPIMTGVANQPKGTDKGQIFISGAKLYFSDGTNNVLVTSA